jgi:hypothetical protein
MEGGCACGAVRYRLASRPLIVPCCHCRWCQRETGSAFVLNARIEADRIQIPGGTPSSKQPWVALPPGTPYFMEFYSLKERWPVEASRVYAKPAPSTRRRCKDAGPRNISPRRHEGREVDFPARFAHLMFSS